MTSSIYHCRVMHHRLRPRERRFEYGVFMLALDLSALPDLAKASPIFGHNRWNLFSFFDRDYLHAEDDRSLRERVLEYVNTTALDVPDDAQVTLLTFPRVLGYQFNPVSFYYFRTVTGEAIGALAEVENTYREKKLYVIPGINEKGWHKKKLPKNFYVSPFSAVTDTFDFQLGPLAEQWKVNINDEDADGRLLVSTIRGKQVEYTNANLLFCFFRYPLLTFRTITLIHWQALKMWLGKYSIHNKRSTASGQTHVLRPHKTLREKS